MKKNNVLEFIERAELKFKEHLESGRFDSNERERLKLELRLEILEEIKFGFEWASSEQEDKQASRILKLAKDRHEGFDEAKQLRIINLYSKLRETLPYIKATNYVIHYEEFTLTEKLIKFCESQIGLIDKFYNTKYEFPSENEINEAFESYNNQIKVDRIPSLKVYKQPEVKQKIGELYDEFMKNTK